MISSTQTRILGALLTAMLCSSLVPAQSGRGRPTPPPPRPTPGPNVPSTGVLNVPEGGRLTRHDIDGITTRYAMRNGMMVVFRERHASPLVAITLYIKAGAFAEKDNEAGLAQLTARMLLKGTSARAAGEIEKEIQKLGGVFGFNIDHDHVAFNIAAPAESAQKAGELLAELILNPAFPENQLKRSVQEVARAGLRFDDDAAQASFDYLYSTAFTVHPLRRSRFGTEESLAAFTRAHVAAFHQNHYQPQNAVLSIAGDVIPIQTIGRLQLAFGKWTKSAAAATPPAAQPSTPPAARAATPATTRTQPTTTNPAPGAVSTSTATTAVLAAAHSADSFDEPAQDVLRYGNARGATRQTYITIGYHTPAPATTAAGYKERATLEVLAAVLGLGRGARLFQVLRDGSRLSAEARDKGELASLVTDVSAEYRAWQGASMLVVQLRVDPERIDRAEAEYFREIERFKRERISEGELHRARFMLEKRHHDSIARLEDDARLAAHFQSMFGDARQYDAHLSRIQSVTAQDVQAAAAKYLTLANTTLHEFEPATAQARTFTPETFAETMTIFAPTLARAVAADEVKTGATLRTFTQGAERGAGTVGRNVIIAEAPLPVKDYSVFRGPRAFVREDRSRPKISVGVFFQGGRLLEDASINGLTELMLRAMLKGTQTRKSDLIALELESYGGEIRIVNEPDLFGLVLDVLSRNTEPATRLLLDLVENPYFDKAELAREREVLLGDQLAASNHPIRRAEELMWASLYPGHPYGLPRLGSPQVVKSITVEQLEDWHSRSVKRQLPMVIVVGDTDGSALVSRIFAEAFKRGELDKSLKVNLPPLTAPPDEMAEIRGRAQSVQAVGIRTNPGQGNEPYSFEILAQALAGRLIADLVIRQGIADEVSVISTHLLASGAFGAIVVSAPEHEANVRAAIQTEIARLAGAPPADDDFDRARNVAIGSYALGLQRHSERALEYARLAIAARKTNDAETQPDLIRAVRQIELRRFAYSVIKVNQLGMGVVRAQ
jgi:zinc protease